MTKIKEPLQVVLVSMPFGPVYVPSIGLTLLKSVCRDAGHNCSIRYSNLAFAHLIGPKLFQAIAEGYPHNIALAGDWLFSGALTNDDWRNREEYFRWLLEHHDRCLETDPKAHNTSDVRRFLSELAKLVDYVEPFLADEVEQIARRRPDVIGLTSVFQQNTASLAIARRLRQRLPFSTIILGGANCEGSMGKQILASFPFVDAIVDGEGEAAFADALRQLSTTGCLSGRGNLRCRELANRDEAPQEEDTPSSRQLPAPNTPLDYSEYFEQRAATFFDTEIVPIHLPFETARGCWWGAKNHCTFCGLNGRTMTFRSREPLEAIDELARLVQQYGSHPIDAVDNIMDNRYLDSFVPELAKRQLGLSVFYEVKSNLSRVNLVSLKSAGIDRIQPGIESLSSSVLRLMRKGVTGTQNIMLLKWCKELDVSVSWNYLWGFPGEDVKEFSNLAELCRKLTHLPAPQGAGPIRLDRFSPNFEKAEQIGFSNIRAFPSYSFVYEGIPSEDVERLSYFFTFDYANHPSPSTYVLSLVRALREWILAERKCELVFTDLEGELLVVDTRPCAIKSVMLLDHACSKVMSSCTKPLTREMLIDGMKNSRFENARIQAAIELLLAHSLLVELDNLLLPLALSLEFYQPRGEGLLSVVNALRDQGIKGNDGNFHLTRCHLLLST